MMAGQKHSATSGRESMDVDYTRFLNNIGFTGATIECAKLVMLEISERKDVADEAQHRLISAAYLLDHASTLLSQIHDSVEEQQPKAANG